MVPAVGNIELISAQADPQRLVKFTVTGAFPAKRQDKITPLGKNADPIIAGIGDINKFIIECDPLRAGQRSFQAPAFIKGKYRPPGKIKLLDAVIPRICNIHAPVSIDRDVARPR